MSDIRPLWVWGDPTPEQVEIIRLAKNELGVDFYVKPKIAEPGIKGNVLAFKPVPFVVNGLIANLTPPYTLPRMKVALAEVLGVTEPVHLMSTAQQLSEWFGSKVTELYEEEIKDAG